MPTHTLPHLIFDLEGNGLYDTVTQLHCAVTKDILTGIVRKFIFPQDKQLFLDLMSQAYMLCAHNGIDYDFPVLKKLWGWTPNESTIIVDTLVMSRLLNPDRTPVEGVRGPHSVESWGKRLGRWKPDHSDWSQFSPEMLHRCEEDVEIQHLIYETLCREANVTSPTHNIFSLNSYNKEGINWATAMYYEHKSAQIFREQQENGVYFEKEKAEEYIELLDNLVDKLTFEIAGDIPPKPKQKGVSINEPYKQNGDYKKTVLDWFASENLKLPSGEPPNIGGPFSRVWWSTINLDSDIQLKEWLFSIGWEPDEWNYHKTLVTDTGERLRTSPKITESSLERLSGNLGPMLVQRSRASHRRNQIAGWIGHTRADHRLQAEANPQGTPTGRARHRIVANVPKANSDKKTHKLIWYPDPQAVFFGTEMRSLFSAGPDSDIVLVGRDASGLELRCFAHYLDDKKYTEVLLEGDIHEYNQELAGLETREQAKTFIYAFLYGAGEVKLGSIVLPTGTKEIQQSVGADLKRRFLDANPKLKGLVNGVRKASDRGYLIGLDGRKLNMRRDKQGRIAKSKSLNTLLQGAGAIIMTYARCWLYDELHNRGWHMNDMGEAIKVLDYHDEETYQCREFIAKDLSELMIQSVVEAGKYYNLTLPLDAEAKIGQSWAEIH